MKKQNKRENWEEEYWDLWQKEDDLTHLDDDVLVFIRQLLAQKEKEVKEKQEEINRLNRFITRAIGASSNGYVPCDYLKLGLSAKNDKTK